jgi:hypothetical protein
VLFLFFCQLFLLFFKIGSLELFALGWL